MDIKFQYASDLHLEFPENWELFIKDPKNVLSPVADNLLLAGDIFSGNKNCNHLKQEFAKYLQDNWKHIFVIPGNHEYYVSWRNSKIGNFDLAKNDLNFWKGFNTIHELNNTSSTIIPGIRIIGSTLWSDIPQEYIDNIWYGMNDYNLIFKEKDKTAITPVDTIAKFDLSLKFIKDELKLAKKNKEYAIVLTHHCPTKTCLSPRHINKSVLNHAYYSELDHLFDRYKIGVWVCGHTHIHNTQLIGKNNSLLLQNCLGYVRYEENAGYRPDAQFTINLNHENA